MNSVEWYVRRFNAKVLYEDLTWAMLDIGGQRVALTVPSEHPPHIAINIEKFDNFPEGTEIRFHRDGSMYCYVTDLDSNTVEYIYWPKEASNERDNKSTEEVESWESI